MTATSPPLDLDPSEYVVVLTAVGPNRLQVMKVLRDFAGMSLPGVQALVNACATEITEVGATGLYKGERGFRMGKREAERIRDAINAVGGSAEMVKL